MTNGYHFRDAQPEDMAYIRTAFCRLSLPFYTNGGVPSQSAIDAQNYVFNRLVASASFMVACADADPGVILCWAVYNPERKALHYIHTRHETQKAGVARAMIEEVTAGWPYIAYSHKSREWLEFVKALRLHAHFDPYLAFMEK